MKHNFSFLPSLRRTTLLALLCLGIMPAFAETVYYICFGRAQGYPEFKTDISKRTTNYAARDLYMQDKGNGLVEYVWLNANPNDASYMWRKIDTGADYNIDNQTCDVVYLQNVGTGQYLYCSTTSYSSNCGGDWPHRTTATGAKQENDYYKWFFDNGGSDGGYEICMIISRAISDSEKSNPSYKLRHLHSCNQYNNCTDTEAFADAIPCGSQGDRNTFADAKIIPVEYTPVDPCPNCGMVPAK